MAPAVLQTAVWIVFLAGQKGAKAVQPIHQANIHCREIQIGSGLHLTVKKTHLMRGMLISAMLLLASIVNLTTTAVSAA